MSVIYVESVANKPIMLSVIMLNVIMLSVVTPPEQFGSDKYLASLTLPSVSKKII